MVVDVIVDTKLKFKYHLEDKINKCNRIISSIKKNVSSTTKKVSSDYL